MVQPLPKEPADEPHAIDAKLELETAQQLRELARVDLELARFTRLEALQRGETAKRRELALEDEVERLRLRLDAAVRREATADHILQEWKWLREDRAPNLLRSLQQLAACALAGTVVTGTFLGHTHWGFDPRYIGVAVGLVFGSVVWAVRGL